MSYELQPEDFGHPDSAIRLASAVHKFQAPLMDDSEKRFSFASSFRTTGTHPGTRKVLLKADDARKSLDQALGAKKVSSERLVADARRYIPLIHQILLSCKVQPEVARLDERLLFQWTSGLEKESKVYKSEALMYDLVMAIVCEGMGRAGSATENSIAGDFAAASRDYAAASGVFAFLANDQLPKWIAKGSKVDEDSLPLECSVNVTKALQTLFAANGQQMAIATVLIKKGVPNYSLLAKLCLGVHEQLDSFVGSMRKDAFALMERMEEAFFTLMAFQIPLHKSLSLYFQARSEWDKMNYGIAIALLSEATVTIRTRATDASPGVPDVAKIKALKPLHSDLEDLREHMQKLLTHWETDNSKVYFENVPQVVPAESKLQEGLKMSKTEPYNLEDVDPLLLILPEENDSSRAASSLPPPPGPPPPTAEWTPMPPPGPPPGSPPRIERSDSDLARELQRQWNMEG